MLFNNLKFAIPEEKTAPAEEKSQKTKIAPVQKKEPKVTPSKPVEKPKPIEKVKPEEAEILPPPEPEKPDFSSAKKASEIIRDEIANSIENLYKNVEEIRKDFMSYRLQQQLKILLDKVERLIDAENEEGL